MEPKSVVANNTEPHTVMMEGVGPKSVVANNTETHSPASLASQC